MKDLLQSPGAFACSAAALHRSALSDGSPGRPRRLWNAPEIQPAVNKPGEIQWVRVLFVWSETSAHLLPGRSCNWWVKGHVLHTVIFKQLHGSSVEWKETGKNTASYFLQKQRNKWKKGMCNGVRGTLCLYIWFGNGDGKMEEEE